MTNNLRTNDKKKKKHKLLSNEKTTTHSGRFVRRTSAATKVRISNDLTRPSQCRFDGETFRFFVRPFLVLVTGPVCTINVAHTFPWDARTDIYVPRMGHDRSIAGRVSDVVPEQFSFKMRLHFTCAIRLRVGGKFIGFPKLPDGCFRNRNHQM